MNRRSFITLLGGAAAAWPLAARAQQAGIPVVGFLSSASREPFMRQLAAFHQGLREVGYVEDRNVAIEYRWADGRYDRLPALAAELVRRQVALIVAVGGGTSARAATAESATIPILVVTGSDPVQLGVEARLRPGARNLTGVGLYTNLLAPKRLEYLREVVPGAGKLAMLMNPSGALADTETRDIETAARNIGLQLLVLKVSSENEFFPVLAQAAQEGADTLLVSSDPFFTSRRAQLVALAKRHALFAIYPWRDYVETGGLMSYGPRLSEAYYSIGLYAGRILKGATPADLPVRMPQKFELVINLKTAKALGLNVPVTLLVIADEVIE